MLLEGVLDDRFEIREAVATGGMGRIFRGWDREANAPVAVKALRVTGPAELERFARESAILAQLSHPDIVRYVAHGTTPAGDLYLVMEWLEGETLADRMGRDGLTADESVRAIAKVAAAVGELHRRGLVHRDIKPENLLLPGGDLAHIKLIDFGIARAGELPGLTKTGCAVGTLGYMAPEQARAHKQVDARVDVFALGCVLYECLTGKPLYLGGSPFIVQTKVLFEDPPTLGANCPEAPPALEQLVAAMLAKDPAQRPADGAAVATALEQIGPIAGDRRRQANAGPPPAELPKTRNMSADEMNMLLRAGEDGLFSLIASTLVESGQVAGAPTMSLEELSALQAALNVAVQPLGARAEVLADGSVLAMLSSTDVPAEHAARAARCALAVRSLVSTPVALVSGRGALFGAAVLEDVIQRGARAAAFAAVVARRRAAGGSTDAVLLDELTAELLDARFVVSRKKQARYLHGERQS